MIGEISFIQGRNASATVMATVPCHYVFWREEVLRGLLRRNPNIDVTKKRVFSLDLTRELTADNSGTIRTNVLE